jgi:hypothetical protein
MIKRDSTGSAIGHTEVISAPIRKAVEMTAREWNAEMSAISLSVHDMMMEDSASWRYEMV